MSKLFFPLQIHFYIKELLKICIKEYRVHHPERDYEHISYSFILRQICIYYMRDSKYKNEVDEILKEHKK